VRSRGRLVRFIGLLLRFKYADLDKFDWSSSIKATCSHTLKECIPERKEKKKKKKEKKEEDNIKT